MSDEKSQQQTSTESTVAGAAKAGKAISNIAKGAAAGGAHGAAIEAGKSSAKWLIPLIAAVLLPLILVAMLPSIIFGSLLGDGTDSPNGISNDEVLVQNMTAINEGISFILSEGLTDVLERIDSDFASSGCDGKEINNPFGADVVFNANAFVSQYCAHKDIEIASISKEDMEALLTANKDKLYSFAFTDEEREIPPEQGDEGSGETIHETIRIYTISYNGEAYFADQVFHLSDDQKLLASQYAQNLTVLLGDGIYQGLSETEFSATDLSYDGVVFADGETQVVYYNQLDERWKYSPYGSETTTVEITNQRMASIMIHKIDAATGTGIYGVKFVLYDSGKNPIGEYTTDQDGYIYIDDELVPGKYYLRELEAADGYIRDEQYKTVYVERGKCAQIEWENSAVTGQIQIRKYSSEDNTVTGQLAGTPLEGAVFEITQARSGKVVGYIVTDARGVAASGPLPLGRYFVTEVSAPKYYQLSGEKMEAEIEYPSQIIKLSAYNKPASLGVTIKKSGNYEVQSGQSMSYDFSGIANTSNVALNHFFWHDRIPTDATRALSISTGTYNARLYYKVTFKTNLNDYRTLASNLLTSNNYSLSLNAATLRLAQGEYVTDVRFEFGTVPSGFSSVVKPTMRVQVLGTVSNGYQIINRADVGGQYLNEWQTAKTTWVTTVRRFNTTPLPKTGY